MGKVNLNKSSKPKNTDFKRRKAALGRGKHQHLSHTKIDMKTAKIKVLSQSRFENTEVVVEGPTLEQMNSLINMSHSDNEKKVLQGIQGLNSILPKAPPLFIQNTNTILSAVMCQIRHPNADVRNAAQNLISYLFNNYSEICVPLVSTFVRHVSATAVSTSIVSKQQAAMLLDKIGSLQHLQPIPVIFALFPQLVKVSTTPQIFSQFTKPIVKILQRFSQKSNDIKSEQLQGVNFPRVFSTDAKIFSKRFSPRCTLTSDEIWSIDQLMQETVNILPRIKGDEGYNATVDMVSLVLAVKELQPLVDVSPFIAFVNECGWPFEKCNVKKNLACARLLAYDEKCFDSIREFLSEVDDMGILAAIVGGNTDPNSLDKVNPMELCSISIKTDMQPAAALRLANAYITEEHPSKRYLRKLIELKKPEKFQDVLAELLEKKLIRIIEKPVKTEEKEQKEPKEGEEEEELSEETTKQILESEKERDRQGLIISLVSACAPLEADFLKKVMELLVKKVDGEDVYYVPEPVARSLMQAIALTRTTPTKHILSFILSLVKRRTELVDAAKRNIEYLKGYARDEKEMNLFNKINTDNLTVLK